MSNIASIARSSSGTSDYLRVNPVAGPYTLVLVISGTLTADVEFCVEDPDNSPSAIQHDVLNGKTASAASDLQSPVQGVRINITSYTSGTATLTVIDGDV